MKIKPRKPVCFVSIADEKNMKYFERMKKSLQKFHPDIPVYLWTEVRVKTYNDPAFFYRATPVMARELLKEYELVVKIDADSIITGDLNHIINATDYDVAAPLNWNRVDPQLFGPVTVWNIAPQAYFNCGLVAMRDRDFVEKWFRLCYSGHFDSYKYREQDLMNIMAFYFDWRFKNLDAEDSWNGLISKGEWMKLEVKDNKLICPPAKDRFPDKEMTIKVLHFAGGDIPGDKFDAINTRFKPEVQEFLKELMK